MSLEAILCEGSAEEAIVKLLLENSRLIIKQDNILDNAPIRIRSANTFCEKYLRRDFDGKLTVYRVLDSRKENFRLTGQNKKIFEDKLDVINIITAPEIEILYILAENKYQKYGKSKKKASEFCKQDLKCKEVKSYDFIYSYFADIDKLLTVLKEYDRIHKKQSNELSLYDLLDTQYKT